MLGGVLFYGTNVSPATAHNQANAKFLPCYRYNPKPTRKRGNGRPIDTEMASKEESSKTQRAASPQAEHTSPRKRRKVNHGGYDFGYLYTVSVQLLIWHSKSMHLL